MNHLNNFWKLAVMRFFHSLIPAYVIERLYWEQKGMTIEMVIYTEIIYAVTIILLEIPTGIIADKWGRKQLIVVSAFLACLEFLILLFATNFWYFAMVVFLAGISYSTSSGAENAILYDSLLLHRKEQSFEKLVGWLNVFDFSSAIIASLCGSLLANHFGFAFNYWLSLVSTLIAFAVSFLLIEPPVRSKEDTTLQFKEYIQNSLEFFKENFEVKMYVFVGIITGSALNFIDEFWQLYLDRLQIPLFSFGLFSAGFMLLRLPGNILAHKLKKRFRVKTLLLVVIFCLTLGFLSISVSKGYIGLVAIFLICLFSGIVEPITTGYLHHRVDSSMRATIDSFQSLGLNVAQVIMGLGFGYFSSRFDIFGGYGFISLICGVFLVYSLISCRKNSRV